MVVIREPAVAGRFYPSSAAECEAQCADCCQIDDAEAERFSPPTQGAIVPHAGWMCSGRVAGRVLAVLQRTSCPSTIVLFGAMHRVRGHAGLLFPAGQWRTPLGSVTVDERLAERVMGHTNLIAEDIFAHEDEHSLEVQLPFVRWLFPDVPILPILVPPLKEASAVGESVGRALDEYGIDAIVVGSTDLTHYGPSYGFAPKGTGPDAFAWAKSVNDVRIIDLMTSLRADDVVTEASRSHNACGAGAVAATIAAVKRIGATTGTLLEHTTSREVLGDEGFGGAVGYAGIVYS